MVAALGADRHLLLEGPPGTGKSTVLRAVAQESGVGFEFVEGNAELTPARLVGTFDPAAVLSEGYSPEVFVDGPLVSALRDGSLLYVEEINRIPEETLNVLITVMSEGELHVPRLGHVLAAPGFRLVAAMNPFDAIGTARIASAVYDRVCRLAMGYQDAEDEARIVSGAAPDAAHTIGSDGVFHAVAMVRDSRDHGDLRTGSSVRGAIDFVLVAEQLAASNGPIGRVDYVDVRQSMRNGGGPACLRLRVVLTEDELAATNPAMRLTDELHGALSVWALRWYRDSLTAQDLADPALLDETRGALDELTGILGLGTDFYPFQRV